MVPQFVVKQKKIIFWFCHYYPNDTTSHKSVSTLSRQGQNMIKQDETVVLNSDIAITLQTFEWSQ